MMLEPGSAGHGKVHGFPLVGGGFHNEERVVIIDAFLQNLPHFHKGESRVNEPDRSQAMNAPSERLYRLVYLLIVLVVVELIGD